MVKQRSRKSRNFLDAENASTFSSKPKPKYSDRIEKTEPEKTREKENKTVKPKINETVRFIYIVMLVVFVPLAIYLLATFQLLAFFIMVGATFVLMQIVNWAFKRTDDAT